MKKDYENLIICFIELFGADILTLSKDNDATDETDWDIAGDGWGE